MSASSINLILKTRPHVYAVLISKSVCKLLGFYVEKGTRSGFTSKFSAHRGALTRKIDDCPKRLNWPPVKPETEEWLYRKWAVKIFEEVQ